MYVENYTLMILHSMLNIVGLGKVSYDVSFFVKLVCHSGFCASDSRTETRFKVLIQRPNLNVLFQINDFL